MSVLNAIGSFNLLDIQGADLLPHGQAKIIERDGIDGFRLLFTGYRPASPFTLRTFVDCANMVATQVLYQSYVGLCPPNPPVAILWKNVNLSAGDLLYQVLRVRKVDARPLILATPGLDPPSAALLICDWDLLPVPVS
jgi:hypothetical protein